MMDRIKSACQLVAGLVCVIVGFAGILLPIIPGVPILLLGLHLIGVRIPLVDKWTARFRKWLEDRQNRNRSPGRS